MSRTLDLSSRPYRDERDMADMIAFVQNAAQRADHVLDYLHCGDITWRMFRALEFDPHEHIHLWQTAEGQLVGFAWFYQNHNGVDLQVDPAWRGRGLSQRMIAWAEQVARRRRGRLKEWSLRFNCFDHDLIRRESLMRAGYRPDSFYYVHFQRALDADLSDSGPELRDDGYRLRGTESEEAAMRANLHDAAFFITEVTSDSYCNVMGSAGYRPELDVVEEAPNGDLAAFALCWADPATKIGLFEPVGTHPAHRRQGLAQAVVREGLRRLRAAGMETAWVYTEAPNLPAQRLYASLGFKIVGKQYDYVK